MNVLGLILCKTTMVFLIIGFFASRVFRVSSYDENDPETSRVRPPHRTNGRRWLGGGVNARGGGPAAPTLDWVTGRGSSDLWGLGMPCVGVKRAGEGGVSLEGGDVTYDGIPYMYGLGQLSGHPSGDPFF